MGDNGETAEETVITPKQAQKIRASEIGDSAIGEVIAATAGSHVPMEIGEQEKVLEFYYHPYIPESIREEVEKYYFAYIGTEIPTSNLNDQDSIWMLAYLRDLQFLKLKFGKLHGNILDVAIANNLIVQTRANIKMGTNGFGRKLDKSFQIGYKPDVDSENVPQQKKGIRKFFP